MRIKGKKKVIMIVAIIVLQIVIPLIAVIVDMGFTSKSYGITVNIR